MRPANNLSAEARGAAFGLAAAALFGASAPLAKVLLGEIAPVLLAGLLYLGAALGLSAQKLLSPRTQEAPLIRKDVVTLGAVVVFGGMLGPVLMLLGLARVSGLAGSLLLNLEAPLTVLLAVLVFHEHLGKSAAIAVFLIVGGAGILKLESGEFSADTTGAVLIASACLCWAIDNNLTQRLTLKDPFAVVRTKTMVAGLANSALGVFVFKSELSSWTFVVGALLLGGLSYGVSVVLDAFALRWIGAAREAAYFATAPFVGALTSVVLLNDTLRAYDLIAMLLMATGVVFLLREKHSHEHEHEELEHEHLHEHDEHHQHQHAPGDPLGEPHSHAHRHERLVHTHPHVPDAHHRHRH